MRGGRSGTANRRSTPKVKDGKVQKKNRWIQSANFYLTDPSQLVIERRNPGPGAVHLIDRFDIERFIRMIPQWQELARGLRAIVLAEDQDDCMGWHEPGVIHLCPWAKDLWLDVTLEFFQQHAGILQRLKVPHQKRVDGEETVVRCFFSEENAKAFQLLHIFLHELGHHHDRMTSKNKKAAVRGEDFAVSFAKRYEEQIFQRYVQEFRPAFARRK